MRLRMGTFATAIALSLAVGAVPALAGSGGHAKRQKVFVVCKHGCPYRSIQRAARRRQEGQRSVIKIRPGTYAEGVSRRPQVRRPDVRRHRQASPEGGPRRQERQGERHRATGRRTRSRRPTSTDSRSRTSGPGTSPPTASSSTPTRDDQTLQGLPDEERPRVVQPRLRPVREALHRRPDHESTGWGHGDSAIYIGETRRRTNPKWTTIDHD